MQVFQGFEAARSRLDGCAVALGNFDGVHLGHQALFAHARARAGSRNAATVAATFEPHPSRFLSPHLGPKLLTPLRRKLELLQALGLDAVVVQPFDARYAAMSSDHFLDAELFGRLAPADVVVGPDFTFGRERAGTVAQLGEACTRRGVGFTEVPPVRCEGVIVSSTRIREFIAEGRVAAAAQLLGRPFDLLGRVVAGFGRGRTLGFPTANLLPENEVRPAHGVYAVRVLSETGCWPGAANVGRKPTFGDDDVTVEVHVIGFEGDLYGVDLSVEFIERLRGEQRFGSPAELRTQIVLDCAKAEAVVQAAPPPGPLSAFRGPRNPAVPG